MTKKSKAVTKNKAAAKSSDKNTGAKNKSSAKLPVVAAVKKSSNTKQPRLLRGMKDILPKEQEYWECLKYKAEELASIYGFKRIDTPVLEPLSLFLRGVGADTEIVQKQMFTLDDAEGEKICLRPENTAPIARAYVEHGMLNLPQPVKLYYWAPQFRHERPQAGRFRQFYQFGLEVLGDANPVIDAQIVLFSYTFLKELGISCSIQINSLGCPTCRKNYNKRLLEFLRIKKRFLCADCQRRLLKNPLRVLDCKNEECQKVCEDVPQIVDFVCEECKEHFIKVLEFLDELEIPYNLNSRVVRGLDYYTKTIFEIWPEGENAGQGALGGGGRYDNLVEEFGGQETPACGVAFGMERVKALIRDNESILLKKKGVEVFLIQVGATARKECLKLFEKFRQEKIRVGEVLSKNGLRQQLEVADKLGVKLVVILGQQELLNGTAIIRDMEDGSQEIVNREKIIEETKKRLKQRVKKIKLR